MGDNLMIFFAILRHCSDLSPKPDCICSIKLSDKISSDLTLSIQFPLNFLNNSSSSTFLDKISLETGSMPLGQALCSIFVPVKRPHRNAHPDSFHGIADVCLGVMKFRSRIRSRIRIRQ
jgi:hypothetical protein